MSPVGNGDDRISRHYSLLELRKKKSKGNYALGRPLNALNTLGPGGFDRAQDCKDRWRWEERDFVLWEFCYQWFKTGGKYRQDVSLRRSRPCPQQFRISYKEQGKKPLVTQHAHNCGPAPLFSSEAEQFFKAPKRKLLLELQVKAGIMPQVDSLHTIGACW